jgi:hypothetical protein
VRQFLPIVRWITDSRFSPVACFECGLSNSAAAHLSLREIHGKADTCHASKRLPPRSRRLANPA